MNWEDVGQVLAKNGLDLLASAIPGGVFIQKVVSDLFGVGSNPDDVYQALQKASPDKFIELLKIQNQNKTELEKQKIAAEMAREAQSYELLKGQLEINKTEAASPNLFVAGWQLEITSFDLNLSHIIFGTIFEVVVF